MSKSTTERIWFLLEKKVFPVSSTETLFNQYNDRNPELDNSDAAEIRRNNLRKYLECHNWLSTYFVVGEAPGPWGCRFSGVPFTSEAQLVRGELPFTGMQSSRSSAPYSARGADVFWKVMLPHNLKGLEFFVWDCVPFHPHHKGRPLAPIRTPTRAELQNFSCILTEMVRIIAPKDVVAIGRKAETALSMVNIASKYVRHPSRGGAREFAKGVDSIFRTNKR
jgi:hypothetical protein